MPETEGAIPDRVVHRVAETQGRDPLELPILEDVIDPDALETVIEEMPTGEVSFTYAGQEVTITSDGEITLEDSTVSTSPHLIQVDDSEPSKGYQSSSLSE
ncbi:hypothetical protein HWV07_11505 [Natronomonas salina]|uniref:HalOD1 output domain-containing protein n=1 Tax=Natronomonas salina TaxID=1710540 RepID=UPI0015B4610D|nr:HalOD1 output domain-containing protein [Natronomonas salina]QLD89621.1 hypothetical protein HWV07_11505 [Natronomonas salina]